MIAEIVELAVFLLLFALLIMVCRTAGQPTPGLSSGSAKSTAQVIDFATEEDVEGTR